MLENNSNKRALSLSMGSPARILACSFPIPNGASFREFQKLYKRKWGVDLGDEEALDAFTRLMQYIYLADQANQKDRKQKPPVTDKLA